MKLEEKFDFNNILIVPTIWTTVNSRYNEIFLEKPYPLFAAPMDTVINLNNLEYFIDNGVTVCVPRTISWKEFSSFVEKHKSIIDKLDNIFFSVGFSEIEEIVKNKKLLSINGKNINILIDVANGHLKKIGEYCIELKKLDKDLKIMVGNIANPDTYKYYARLGCVWGIRCGIGNGGGCTTTKHSSVGYPMASLIQEIRKKKNELIASGNKEHDLPKIIADGGMKDYSDIIKALAVGADSVMIGSLFNKCIESAGKNYFMGIRINKKLATWLFKRNFKVKKYFRGMSTKAAQKAMGKTKLKTSEGVIRYRLVEFTLPGWIENFDHYLRNALSYTNCYNLNEFIGVVDIIKISDSSYKRFDK